MNRYPVERIKYCKIVGVLRVENIATILRDFGFKVVTQEPESPDVDVWVYRDNDLVLVIEVTNWKESCYMDFKRAESIRQNFSEYDESVKKLLMVSFVKNCMGGESNFEGLEMSVLEVGFQTQPNTQHHPFFELFKKKGMTDGMRPDSPETMGILKGKLEAYMKEIGLI